MMPVALNRAPCRFMDMMNEMLAPFINTIVRVYLNNILVYLQDGSAHAKHVRCVLRTLRTHQIYAKLSKCQLSKKEIEFLGIWIHTRRYVRRCMYGKIKRGGLVVDLLFELVTCKSAFGKTKMC